jgi:hypothetical protein
MLRGFLNCAKTALQALTSAQWCYQTSINRCIYDCNLRNEKESTFQVRNEFSPYNCQLKNKEAL